MKALILRNDATAALATAHALIDKGFQILSVDTQAVAHALIRIDTIDLLVIDERIEGQLTHAIALSAERKNPYLSAIILTDRTAAETDDLFALIPCLYGLVGHDTGAQMLGKLALSAVSAAISRPAPVIEEDVVNVVDTITPKVPEEPLLLLNAAMVPMQDDNLDVVADVDEVAVPNAVAAFADVAIAAPEMCAVTRAAEQMMFSHTIDPVSAEVAALFRKTALPRFLQAPSTAPVTAAPAN